jgi:hypothetical protein
VIVSVSIALLPVALAIRIVMGKDNFENWVKAQQVRVPSSFKTELELARAVKRAGYDAVKFGASIKTHIDGENTFFFWEFVDGKWIAIFSKRYYGQPILNKFMSSVESAAGFKIFGELANTAAEISTQFPTNFRDGAMLIDALKEFGAHPTKRSDGSITCKIKHSELLFTQLGDSPFMVEVKNSPNLEQVYRYMSDIDDDYKRCVQTAVYEKVKVRAAERDLVIEGEEVLPDKTILITLRVQ